MGYAAKSQGQSIVHGGDTGAETNSWHCHSLEQRSLLVVVVSSDDEDVNEDDDDDNGNNGNYTG